MPLPSEVYARTQPPELFFNSPRPCVLPSCLPTADPSPQYLACRPRTTLFLQRVAQRRYVQHVAHCHRRGRELTLTSPHWSRAKALTKSSTLREWFPVHGGLEGNMHTLASVSEMSCASFFYARTGDDDLCFRPAQFDDRCLLGLPAFAPPPNRADCTRAA